MSETRYPKRQRTAYKAFSIRDAWHAFEAGEQVGEHADHSAQCRVVINIHLPNPRPQPGQPDTVPDGIALPAAPIEGLTGRGNGHAEMDALHNLMGQVGPATMRALLMERAVFLDCVDKPCCAHCSTMLGLLGVVQGTPATRKSRRTMLAGGAWGVSSSLKGFLINEWKLREDDINALSSADQGRFDRELE